MESHHPEIGELVDTLSRDLPAVAGTLDSALRIEQIGSEARVLFDRPAAALIGESLLTLVTEDDVPSCAAAYSEVVATQRGVTVNLNLFAVTVERRREPLLCEVLLLPLRPSPGYAFVLRPVAAPSPPGSEPAAVIQNHSDHADEAGAPSPGMLRRLTECEVPGVTRLTIRELGILSQLLDGHRPPGIARELFLSQSTVRNHLASVFRKLGVTSQETLLALFRSESPEGVAEPTPLIHHGQGHSNSIILRTEAASCRTCLDNGW